MADTVVQQKTVLLGVTGGIAAYKVCDLARRLVRTGYKVKVVMTQHATEFVGPATFRSLTGNPVALDLFDDPAAPINHISLAEETDIFLIAPATANVIAKLAHGRADDLLTTTALAFQGQMLVAPAMNTQMYLDPATQENLAILEARGTALVGPATGELACGDSGPGRMVEVSDLFAAVEENIHASDLLADKHVLISAGPTREYLDPVRYLTNRSSGKMGIALAREALRSGAKVILVLGPVAEAAPVNPQLTRIDVVSTADMHKAMHEYAPEADLIIATAAVSDYRSAAPSDTKIKKQAGYPANPDKNAEAKTLTLEVTETPDILAELGALKEAGKLKPDMTLVGFAAETDNLEANVCTKLKRKGTDFIIANDVSRTDIGFEATDNEVRIFSRATPDDCILLPKASKMQLAREILQRVQY